MTRSYTFERTGNTDIGYQAYSGDQRNIRSVYFFVSCRSRTEVQAIVVWHIIDELISNRIEMFIQCFRIMLN